MNLIKTALQVGDAKYLSPRALAAFAAICISAVHCTPVWCDVFQIDNNSLGSPTEPGWTGLNATNGGNGSGVTVDGVTFRVHAADGHRDRSEPNHLTRDFVFNDGTDQQVGLSISGLADALWRAEVWAWDAWYPADLGPLIVGVTHVPFTGVPPWEPSTIFTTSFAATPTDPFVFEFDSTGLPDGFGIFIRENNIQDRSRLNALRLTQVPEPSAFVLCILVATMGVCIRCYRR